MTPRGAARAGLLALCAQLACADAAVAQRDARFALDGPPSQAFLGDAFASALLPRLRDAAQQALANGDSPAPEAQQLRTGLAWIALLQRRPQDAAALVRAQRASETKPQLRLIGNLAADVTAAGQGAAPGRDCAAEAARAAALLRDAPVDVVRDEVVTRAARYSVASDAYFAGTLAFDLDPVYQARGSLTLLEGLRMAGFLAQARLLPVCRDAVVASLREWLAASPPADIWSAREPAHVKAVRPVVVAVWDSGIDTTLFPDQMVPLRPGQAPLTHDWGMRASTAPLAPLSRALAPRLAVQMTLDKGLMDLARGDDTADAQLAVLRARTASPAEQAQDAAGEDENFLRSHGTAVASEIADGAPFVRLLNLRLLLSFSHPSVPPASEAEVDRFVAITRALPARLRAEGVRIVNMSWLVTRQGIEAALVDRALETDPARAGRRAAAMYAQVAAALRAVMAACPGVLFVAAAGNVDQTDTELAAVPQALRLPNLIVVGAAGASGHATSFTTHGAGVGLYARGEGVLLRHPGGLVRTESGTSMAAPLVARAAAAMLAIRPGLAPAQLIEGLTQTATPGDDGMRLLHAARAVDWAKAGRDTAARR